MSIPWMLTGQKAVDWHLSLNEVHHHLLGLPRGGEMLLLTTVHKVLHLSSVLRVLVISDEANKHRVVGELLQNTDVCVVSEIHSVEGEEDGGQVGPLK